MKGLLDREIFNQPDDQLKFYSELNVKILNIWKNIPKQLHGELLNLFHVNAGYRFGDPFDIFSRYPVPLWSVLYWIINSPQAKRKPFDKEMDLMLTAHAIIMFLHGLDDHLNDGELKPSHLILLLRSEAWRMLQESLHVLAGCADGVGKLISNLFDDYYEGVLSNKKPSTLDDCLHRSVLQTATAVMVPSIAEIICSGNDSRVPEIRKSIEQMGVAWRLTDDASDFIKDIRMGERTTMYFHLPEKGRKLWDDAIEAKGSKKKNMIKDLEIMVNSENLIKPTNNMILDSLKTARECAVQADLEGLAGEFKLMENTINNHLPIK